MKTTKATQKGFTLIEVLIALTIFVIFITSMSSAYLSIARSQREANALREMYSELRHVVTLISEETQSKTIDYGCYLGTPKIEDEDSLETIVRKIPPSTACNELTSRLPHEYLALIDSESRERTIFKTEEDIETGEKKIFMFRETNTGAAWEADEGYITGYKEISLNSFKISGLEFEIAPLIDPFDPENVGCGPAQFQPSVSIYASVFGARSDTEKFDLDLQTSLSSRVYNLQTDL
jgi:prepilin-type N-terminal cleavage/methylation domain-containing protein